MKNVGHRGRDGRADENESRAAAAAEQQQLSGATWSDRGSMQPFCSPWPAGACLAQYPHQKALHLHEHHEHRNAIS